MGFDGSDTRGAVDMTVAASGGARSKYAITKDDIPALIVSCACFLGNIGVGGCVGSLGPAIPIVSNLNGATEADLGILFTMRGVGYFAGTALTTAVLHVDKLIVPKEIILIVSCLCVSIGMGLFTWTLSTRVLMVAALLQGIGCGGMDLGTNCIVSDVWGERINPWMQALHACFGIGALVGPALVGLLGYAMAFRIMALMLVGAAIIVVFKQCSARNCKLNTIKDEQGKIDFGVEMPSDISSGIDSERVDEICEFGDSCHDVAVVEQEQSGDSGLVTKVPIIVQCLCVTFFFVYVGIETGFGGWVPTFSLKEGITNDESRAAYLTAVFYGSLAVGRIISVPVSIYLSSTSMIRIQLLVSLLGGVSFFLFGRMSYALAYFSCSVFGAGLSGLFPLMLVLPMDYGLTMDDATTSRFIIGGTIGEALLPIIIGHTMSYFGSVALLYDTLFIAVAMGVLYIVSHLYLTCGDFGSTKSTDMGDYGILPIAEDEENSTSA